MHRLALMEPESCLATCDVELYAEQQDVVLHAQNRDEKGEVGLLVLPCGFGKTLVAIALILRAVLKRTLWVTPASLLRQAERDLSVFIGDRVVLLESAADVGQLQSASSPWRCCPSLALPCWKLAFSM